MPTQFQTRLRRTPILYRIAIGNAIIIILSAIVGTSLTHFLTHISATVWHFVLFASIGVLISLILNFAILKLSLQPLRKLRGMVTRFQAGQGEVKQLTLEDTDPDIHQLSVALSSLVSQLESSNQQLRVLSERAMNAQEDERKRIARSLHDEIGQTLSTLIINLERLERNTPTVNEDLASRLASIRQLAATSLDCLRGIIYDLRPAILDDLGLLPAIRWYAQTNLEQAGVQVKLDFPEVLPSLPAPLTTTLFRVAQEGINNVIRHAHAKKVSISLGLEEKQVYLRIQDDGQGFDASQSSEESIEMKHWGLIGIQERIELVGGHMSISSDPENGTLLQVFAPFKDIEVP